MIASADVALTDKNSPNTPGSYARERSISHGMIKSPNPIERACNNINFGKVLMLQNQLKNNKILMNMAIHDMRNPANAIFFGVNETIQMLLS